MGKASKDKRDIWCGPPARLHERAPPVVGGVSPSYRKAKSRLSRRSAFS